MYIGRASPIWDNALSSYADCENSTEELQYITGIDNVVSYFGRQDFIIASRDRAEIDDIVFGYIVYNYGRGGYDIQFDCEGDDSCKQAELKEYDCFKAWVNGKWVATFLCYNIIKEIWCLAAISDDIELEGLRVRTRYSYFFEDEEDSDLDIEIPIQDCNKAR